MYTRIKEFRVRQGITQADLARKAGVRRETIVFLEKGKYNPSLRLAHHIACILNTSIEELFFFDDETGPDE
ncbi:transcriptional regulator, XRE family [Methanospirillum hungatei JF-1]|uniref:Transcriptional regulator, XRE family n=1 Tax=Methanospirillum hungatei JF-1 (strain ATCC 27890 / DSM 864 / NBRC 100397 / JF-1) TaxID=323259 RepID=Q2FS81_METHJ|nr:helix-turn-helix transcriptional regulator [Methanospirillum hungatei]ABD42620.1 transcriptional regulator, XRE family [Methanospirillum hungatei JF-1]MCA1915060.1 helix-turn-helix transcriptional regulator [Methanospirillum hungatei]